jgi:glycosyltransferase involved in cell wall biosynthesis
MSQPLRVAIVAPTLGILGGQAVQADALLRGWSRDSALDAWLVPINPSLPRPVRGLSSVKYVRTAATQAVYWPRLGRDLRHADIVHVFSASYTSFLLSPLPAIIVSARLGKPVLLNYHSGEAPDHLRRSRLARRVIGAADHRVVPSRFLADVFTSFGLDSEIIPNVVDRDRFRFRLRDPLRPHLLSTRNFEPLYNVSCTLRAFARIQAARPDATLTLAGGGSEEGVLRDRAGELGLRHVTFAGRVEPARMARLFDSADVYVQTPNVDNMPCSVLEAFASGLPVVSTDVGGVPAMLTHEVHGLLAPPDDDRAIASNVLRLFEEPRLSPCLTAAAYASTEAATWNQVRGRWLSAYRRIAAPGGRGRAA